jgi:hypothetical protein
MRAFFSQQGYGHRDRSWELPRVVSRDRAAKSLASGTLLAGSTCPQSNSHRVEPREGTNSQCLHYGKYLHSRPTEEFGPKFKMHGVEVLPLATPDEAVLFKDRDDLFGHAIAVSDGAVMWPPVPIIRES